MKTRREMNSIRTLTKFSISNELALDGCCCFDESLIIILTVGMCGKVIDFC